MSQPAELEAGGAPREVSLRHLGAALGAAPGPVAAFGQSWSGIGDGRAHVWILTTLVGALLGAVVFPIFWPRGEAGRGEPRPYDAGFAALFGFSVGLLAGAFVAFPMGAAMGALGGALAGGVTAFLARRLAFLFGGLVLAAIGGAGVALIGAWVWVQ
jgi:hypothetical protein